MDVLRTATCTCTGRNICWKLIIEHYGGTTGKREETWFELRILDSAIVEGLIGVIFLFRMRLPIRAATMDDLLNGPLGTFSVEVVVIPTTLLRVLLAIMEEE